MTKRPVKIATAQSQISADIRENGREIRRLMQQARAKGAAIVHFTEGAMSGCSKVREGYQLTPGGRTPDPGRLAR
jgi:predicted amidohydrolase